MQAGPGASGGAGRLLRQLSATLPQTQQEPTFYCNVCFEQQPLSAGVQLACGHRFCRGCMEGYLVSKVDTGSVERVVCFWQDPDAPPGAPNSACNKVLTPEEIRDLLPAAAVERFDRYLVMRTNPHWRTCPASACGHGQTGSPDHPAMTCEACSTAYCYSHSAAHPPTVSCADYEREMLLRDKESQDMVNSLAKRCPNKECGIAIVKRSGCNAMKCARCRQSFCWLCGQSIDAGEFPSHFKWYNLRGCPNKQMSGTAPGLTGRSVVVYVLLMCIVGVPAAVLSLVTTMLAATIRTFCRRDKLTLCRRLETHFTRWTNFFMCPIYSALFLLVLAIYAVIFIVTVLAGLTVRLCRCIFCCKQQQRPPSPEESAAVRALVAAVLASVEEEDRGHRGGGSNFEVSAKDDGASSGVVPGVEVKAEEGSVQNMSLDAPASGSHLPGASGGAGDDNPHSHQPASTIRVLVHSP